MEFRPEYGLEAGIRGMPAVAGRRVDAGGGLEFIVPKYFDSRNSKEKRDTSYESGTLSTRFFLSNLDPDWEPNPDREKKA
jgi:hypothetical protein